MREDEPANLEPGMIQNYISAQKVRCGNQPSNKELHLPPVSAVDSEFELPNIFEDRNLIHLTTDSQVR